MKKHKEYRDIDFINIIEFYLLKILMEKFYLHETGKISLYAPRQQKDSYTKYYKLLIDINEYKNHKLHEEMS